jgi:hypothetical protein
MGLILIWFGDLLFVFVGLINMHFVVVQASTRPVHKTAKRVCIRHMLAKKNEEKNNSYRITIENNRSPQLVILLPTLGSNAPPLSPPPHTHT